MTGSDRLKGRLRACIAPAARKLIALVTGSGIAVVATLGRSQDVDPPKNPHLPNAWHSARIDPATGGRYLPDRNEELTRFQERVLRSGAAIPYPHYHDSRTVVMGIRSAGINARTRRRVHLLVDNEQIDPGLTVLIATDEAPDVVAERLELQGIEHREKVSIVRIAHDRPAHITFPFLRDYAPIVRVKSTPDGFQTEGLVLFDGSTLNRVIDHRFGVESRRAKSTIDARFQLTKNLVDFYSERIGHPIQKYYLDLSMDGGNLITDGGGTCFLTKVFLDKNDRSREFIHKELADKVGCVRSVFLDAPQRLDPIQHVDMQLYFADRQNVVLSMPALYEGDRKAEYKNLNELLSMGYKVHRLPRKTASITYANILTTKLNVYVPQYSRYLVESKQQLAINQQIRKLLRRGNVARAKSLMQRSPQTTVIDAAAELSIDNLRALELVQRLLPRKRVVPTDSDDTLRSWGSWHCRTHELPEQL